MRHILILLLGLLLGGCASYTATSGRVVIKDDTTATSGHAVPKNDSAAVAVRFSAGDRTAITDYYRKSPTHSAAGSLPLLRGGWLAADARAEPLPPALERKLSPIPASHARQKVGRDAVIIEKKSRLIADVIFDVAK